MPPDLPNELLMIVRDVRTKNTKILIVRKAMNWWIISTILQNVSNKRTIPYQLKHQGISLGIEKIVHIHKKENLLKNMFAFPMVSLKEDKVTFIFLPLKIFNSLCKNILPMAEYNEILKQQAIRIQIVKD